MGPAARSIPQDIRATLLRILVYMGGLGLLAIAAASVFEAAAPSAAIFSPPPRTEWITVERPHPAFELGWSELSGVPYDYAILRRPDDGARKDVMTWGEAAADEPFAVVEIDRPGHDSEPFIDPSSEIAARIVAFTVTDDVKPAGTIDTKFGAVTMIDFAIAQSGNEHRCLGFARVFEAPAMQIAGWFCSAGNEVIERSALGCAIDRLTILSAGGDPTLDRLFAQAELKRTFCDKRSPILAATPERESTIAAPPGTKLSSLKLRGRLQTR